MTRKSPDTALRTTGRALVPVPMVGRGNGAQPGPTASADPAHGPTVPTDTTTSARPPSTPASRGLASLAAGSRHWHDWRNEHACLLDHLADALEIGVYAVTFFKDANTTPAFRAYLLAHVAAVLACAAGRTPRRREVLAAALRLATFVIPAWAHHGLRKLDQPPPELSSPALQALAFAGVLLLTSGTLSAFGLALSRRVRLWGQVVLQAVTMAVILPHADEMCRTATLRQAAVGEQLAGVYRFMEALALLTPVSGVMELHHSAHGRCRCVVGMMQWTLGFWVPLAMSAALESRAHRQWEQSQAPQAGQRLRTQPGHGGTGPWPQLGQRLQLAFYRRVHAIMDSRDLVWAGLGLTVLLQTWTALALLTPE